VSHSEQNFRRQGLAKVAEGKEELVRRAVAGAASDQSGNSGLEQAEQSPGKGTRLQNTRDLIEANAARTLPDPPLIRCNATNRVAWDLKRFLERNRSPAALDNADFRAALAC
jgi:hypothetical protein